MLSTCLVSGAENRGAEGPLPARASNDSTGSGFDD